MQPAAEEYVTDVPYLRGFAGDLAPVRMRLVAALNGFPQPPAEEFAYCELGSGHGDTTAALAAAYPRARVFGVDINPEHVASARALASDGALTNVTFLERDFEDLGAGDLPDLDYVAAHGVLSWIGPAKQKALVDLAARRLKPGGLLYVGYNALPGWAAVEPLRRLMLDRGAAAGGNTLDRAREGVALANALCDGGAQYFASNPAAKTMLDLMQQMGPAYVAHEYLHAHWRPMYFTEVAAEMAAVGLYFVGQSPLHLNYRDLAIPKGLASLFAGVGDRVTFESLKDYALNQFFRRDVFIKGAVGAAPQWTSLYLDATPFGLLLGAGALARTVRVAHHTWQFTGPLYDALFAALGAGATTVRDLARDPSLAPFGIDRVREGVMHLVIAGQASPTLRPTRSDPAPRGPFRIPSAYDRAALERLSRDRPIVLASPLAGTGVPIAVLDAVILRMLTEAAEPEWPAWVARFVARQPFALRVGDRAVEGDEERARVILAQVPSFYAERLPALVELGIVAGAGR